MEDYVKMTTEEKNEFIADRMAMIFYCYGLFKLGKSIEEIMQTDMVKNSGLGESVIRSFVLEIGPRLVLALS